MKIFQEDEQNAIKRIKNKQITASVVGVGTVGLPLAVFLAKEGFTVYGLDVNKRRVEEINSASVVLEYPDILKEVVSSRKLRATLDPKEAIESTDIVFICVPTPLDQQKNIDLKMLMSAAKSVSSHLSKGTVIILESSVSIGNTREMAKFVETETGMVAGIDFGVAYCPERYNPGLPKEKHPGIVYDEAEGLEKSLTFDHVSRIVGGINEKSLKIAKTIYSEIIKTTVKELSSMEAAEATKLVENIFRDVNIALVNELARVYPKLGLNVFEIIDAAKTKPFAFLPHYPGAGVGGECIPVDTWYLIKQAEKMGIDTRLLKATRDVNDSMPAHVVSLLEDAMKSSNSMIQGSNVLVLGLAYKKNVHDTRLSPAYEVAELLRRKGAIVHITDPVVHKHNVDSSDLVPFENCFDNKDAIVLVTDHDEFSGISLSEIKSKMKKPILIDGRNFFNEKDARSLGFVYRCIGKPEVS